MPFPTPTPGLVIRYSYLWAAEHRRGQEEGVKDRPCAVVLTVTGPTGDPVVTVLPVTHSPPSDPALAVEIPPAVKHRLRLDDERSWVVLTEANRFVWPGPDLRPLGPDMPNSTAYGSLPYALFEEIRRKFIASIKAKTMRPVPRST